MLNPVIPLSSISFMKPVEMMKSLCSDESEEKSENEKLKEKVEELEEKVEKKPDRIGGRYPQPEPNENDDNPFEVDNLSPWNPDDLTPKTGDYVYETAKRGEAKCQTSMKQAPGETWI